MPRNNAFPTKNLRLGRAVSKTWKVGLLPHARIPTTFQRIVCHGNHVDQSRDDSALGASLSPCSHGCSGPHDCMPGCSSSCNRRRRVVRKVNGSCVPWRIGFRMDTHRNTDRIPSSWPRSSYLDHQIQQARRIVFLTNQREKMYSVIRPYFRHLPRLESRSNRAFCGGILGCPGWCIFRQEFAFRRRSG